MATSRQCSMCQKEVGAMYCIGCDVYFCTKDFKGHRTVLFNEMDGLVGKCNDLQVKINDVAQQKDPQNAVITRINEWEKMAIERVKQEASRVRQHAHELINSKRMTIMTEFKIFSEELTHLKETENFVEQDLTRLKDTIENFYEDLEEINESSKIELHTEQSDLIDWNSLIYLVEKSNEPEHGQQTSGLSEYIPSTERQLSHNYSLNN